MQRSIYCAVIRTESNRTVTQTKNMTHKDLVISCQKGDRKAFRKIYDLYAKAMFNVCIRFMRDAEEARDTLQEAFTYAFSKIHSYRFESSFGSWLKRIVINTCISEIRRRKADLQFFEDMSPFNERQEEPFDERLLSAERIKEAMKVLPQGSRMIFSMYLLEGLDHGEIARYLGISEATSRSQYLRAKNKVKELLANEYLEYQV